uniref:Glycogen synthase kinase binding protein n=1 Tax=Cyprinus carpio carpio TaxID=630221 RepID=A0A9J8CHC5_CYPCA
MQCDKLSKEIQPRKMPIKYMLCLFTQSANSQPCRRRLLHYCLYLSRQLTKVHNEAVCHKVEQLKDNSSSQKAMSRLHGLASSSNNNNNNGGSSSAAGGQRCIRLRSRSLRSRRASPYNAPGSSDQEWDHFRSSWNRKKIDEDDPHQLLQELILSGNLIKEAVRRLQFSSEPTEHDISKSVD